MKIPEHLHPRNVANTLGISLGMLALELEVSYHTLHGWNRRGTAPPYAIRFLETEVPKVKERVQAKREAMEPEEAIEDATRVPPRPKPRDARALPPGMKGLLHERRGGKK